MANQRPVIDGTRGYRSLRAKAVEEQPVETFGSQPKFGLDSYHAKLEAKIREDEARRASRHSEESK